MKNKNSSKASKKKLPSKISLSSQLAKTKNNILNKTALIASPTMMDTKPLSKKRADKYRDIIENIQEGIFEVDLTGNFTFVNNEVCSALGYTKEKLIGINSRQFTDKDDNKKVMLAK